MKKNILLVLFFLFCIKIANCQSQIQDDAFSKLREGLGNVWKIKPMSIRKHQQQSINRLIRPLKKFQDKHKYLQLNQQTNNQISQDQDKPLASISEIINIDEQFNSDGSQKATKNDKKQQKSYLSLSSSILITTTLIVLCLGVKYLRSEYRVIMKMEQNTEELENIVTV